MTDNEYTDGQAVKLSLSAKKLSVLNEMSNDLDKTDDSIKKLKQEDEADEEEVFKNAEECETDDKLVESRSNNMADSSLLSSSSSTSSLSMSPNLTTSSKQAFQPLPGLQIAAEWYKQYEDRILNHKNAVLPAGLQYLKPSVSLNSRLNSPLSTHHSSPIVNQTGSAADSLMLMERFYSSHLLPPPQPPVATGNSTSFNILKNSNLDQVSDKQLLVAQQALFAQYAQHLYISNHGTNPSALSGTNKLFNPHLSSNNNSSNNMHFQHSQHNTNGVNFANGPIESHLIEKEREHRYLASLNLYHQNMTSTSSPFHHHHHNHHHAGAQFVPFQSYGTVNREISSSGASQRIHNESISPAIPSLSSSSASNNTNNNSFNQSILNNQNNMDRHVRTNSSGSNINANSNNANGRRRANNSSGSRSPSPTSSQLSGNVDCDEDEEDCDETDSQSLNAANGEWTYEEQFKQVNQVLLFFLIK